MARAADCRRLGTWSRFSDSDRRPLHIEARAGTIRHARVSYGRPPRRGRYGDFVRDRRPNAGRSSRRSPHLHRPGHDSYWVIGATGRTSGGTVPVHPADGVPQFEHELTLSVGYRLKALLEPDGASVCVTSKPRDQGGAD